MGATPLLNERMHDGSRQFAALPQSRPPLRVLIHVLALPGALPTAYVPSVVESWIDFRYKGHKFSVNNQFGEFWFFVQDATCPESVLARVAAHFAKLLNPSGES